MKGPILCCIVVRGQLSGSWADWFDPLEIAPMPQADGILTTCLMGQVPDQPALFGLLLKVRDLNLELIQMEVTASGSIPDTFPFHPQKGG